MPWKVSTWGQRGWEEAHQWCGGRAKTNDPDAEGQKGIPRPSHPGQPHTSENVQLPIDALCKQGNP